MTPPTLTAALRDRLRFQLQRARASPTAKEVLARNLTYLSPAKLSNIEWALSEIKRNGVAGSFIETGVALGGSGIVIARHLEPGRTFQGYDVFGMIPSPGEADPPPVHDRYRAIVSGSSKGLGGDIYYGYQDSLLDRVSASFASFGVPVDGERVTLTKGLFEDTLHPDGPVAFAHVDCDWYEPVKLSLERIFPHLQPGGYIVSDDYFDYGGAAQAIDEFLAERDSSVSVVAGRGTEHLIIRRS
jgi:O-methyltransferase